MSNDIKVFKMINGEEIIGQVFIAFGDHFEIKEPAQIVLQRVRETPQELRIAVARLVIEWMKLDAGNLKSGFGFDPRPIYHLIYLQLALSLGLVD